MKKSTNCRTRQNRPDVRARKTIAKWGAEACRIAWEQNRLHGEGMTVCSINSGIPIRAVSCAINAWNLIGSAR